MDKTPEQLRREHAEREVPKREVGGQQGAQKAANDTNTRTPQEQQEFRNRGRHNPADMPEDEGGRV